MFNKLGYKTAWFLLIGTVLMAFAIVAVPVWLIQPFAPQTTNNLSLSFLLKSWSPILTIFAALVSIALSVFIFLKSKRWFGKSFLLIPLAVILICAWFARQNHFEWMFNPLAVSVYAKASETDFVGDDDMILAVKIGGDAVAYPVRQMAYHHIVQDVVGGQPITATY